jgi:hypothetical protein
MFLPQQESLPAGKNKIKIKSKYLIFDIKGINVFCREQSIVMNSGKPGYLQFISINNGKLMYNVI